MPPNLAIGAFVLGGVLLLVSVVRGTFKVFGVEVNGASTGRFGRFVAFLAGVVLIITGFFTEQPRQVVEDPASPPESSPPTNIQPTRDQPVDAQQAAPQRSDNVARPVELHADERPAVQIAWRAAQQELMALVATLSDEQKLVLGLNLLQGQDIYAINVRITNVGSVPVDVSPANVRLTYSGTAIPLAWEDDQRFLRPVSLQPRRYAEGMLLFKTSIWLAAEVLRSGQLSYHDNAVNVTFGR